MNKIRQYFNKHPILKKIAKLFSVVAIVSSFLFNALIISSLIINANQQKEDNTAQVLAYGNYQQPKCAYYYSEDGYYSEGRDFLFTTFVSNVLYKTYPVYDNRNHNDFVIDTLHIYVCDWNYFGSSTPQGVYTIVQEIWFEPLTPVPLSYGNSYYVPIDITFYGYLNGNMNLEYTIRYHYLPVKYIDSNGNTYNNFHTTGNAVYDFTNYQNVNFNILDGYLMFKESENLVYWNELKGNNSTNIEETYIMGYEQGYENGKTAGYDEGYQVGSTGMTSNPFNLIRNAFDSIAGILNIQVLPNLTLGVLIFTPIIVVIIIVVVKFLRG